MGRLIDADVAYYAYKPKNCSDEQWNLTTLAKCILNAPTVEAIPKDQYEARLKADMVAMLDELDLKLYEQYDDTDLIKVKYVRQTIQQKINALRGE